MKLLNYIKNKVETFNNWLAVQLTNGTSNMWCAYLFAILAILGFPDTLTLASIVQWTSTTFIQLVMLSVIQVGAAILGAGTDKMIKEMYEWIKIELSEIKIMHNEQKQEIALLKDLCTGCKYNNGEDSEHT